MKDILKNISKNIFILPVLLVMLTLIIGVSFAYYKVSLEGRKEIALNIEGGISLTYSWSNESYTLDTSCVLSDEDGKKLDTYYEFSVSATATKANSINYLIYIEEDLANKIDNSSVVMYLTDSSDNMMKSPTLVNTLSTYNSDNTYKLFVNGFSFVKSGTKTHNYRLRSWIKEGVVTGEYKYKVNVIMTQDNKYVLNQEGIYITNAKYLSDIDVDESLCEIENAYSNKFSTNIELSNSNSSITYQVTIYNSYEYPCYLKEIIKNKYTNEDITYTLEGLNINDTIDPKEAKTFTITYHYKNNETTNTLSADLDFVFKITSYVVDTFEYTGSYEEFVVPHYGLYKIELWGSEGGINEYVNEETVGKGGYTSGVINLSQNQSLYIYVGGRHTTQVFEFAFNGGSPAEAPGGGATDVRLIPGNWNNFESLKSRIMVAAGGGGGIIENWSTSTYDYEGESGDAGGLVGYDANFKISNITNEQVFDYGYSGYGASQIAGGMHGITNDKFYQITNTAQGGFGIGGYDEDIDESGRNRSSSGGSGYYGGGHGIHPGNAWTGGGGGSSFISGHNGCDAITETSTEANIIHTGQSVHYSGYKFSDTIMIDGRGYNWTTSRGNYVGVPSYDGLSIINGNIGNGYAKITFLKE